MHALESSVMEELIDASISDSSSAAPSISLILPAFNEAEVIAQAILEADKALMRLTTDYEIIVVDDGSADSTAAIVQQSAKTNPRVRLVQHSPNQGYGAAIRSGFAASKNDLVVFTDSDCQFDLNELDRFLLLSDRYDIVCGYRIDRKDSWLRCLYSKVYNLLVGALLGTEVRDVDCALKMFHRNVAKNLRITGSGFLVNSEILTQAKQLGHSIVEVGVTHRPRLLGESTVSIRHIPTVLSSLLRYWWNEVQFPDEATRTHAVRQADQVAAGTRRLSQGDSRLPAHPTDGRAGGLDSVWLHVCLVLIAAVFLFTNLGYPLIDRDETRYAEIPREMLSTGNWVLPQLNFETYYDKPPLLYWLCAISFKWFGVSESSARLVPALAALLTLASTMFFGTRIFGKRVGLFAGVVLMLSVGFAFTSRYLLLDGVLSLFVTLSLFTAYEAIRHLSSQQYDSTSPRESKLKWGWWLASGVCVGFGILTKGPIAFVLWLPPVLAMAWLSDLHARLRWWHFGVLGGIAAAVAAPWFIRVHQQDPTFLVEFFYKHHLSRFAGEFHARPIWYFMPVLMVAGHPWSFLTVPYAKFLFGRGRTDRTGRAPADGFLLLWSGWCIVFFSLSSCKLPTYLLPAAPAMALMIGHYLSEITSARGKQSDDSFACFWSARTATVTTCIAGIAFVLYVTILTQEVTILQFAWALLWASLLMTSVLLMADRYQARFAWGASAGTAFLFAIMLMHHLVPSYSRLQTIFGDPSPLARQIEADERPAIATVRHEFAGVPFYLGRNDIPNFSSVEVDGLRDFVAANGSSVLIVHDRMAMQELQKQLPADFALDEIGRRGPARIYRATVMSQAAQIAADPFEPTRGVENRGTQR